MKRGSVVIGAGFGDEGKGLMTDALAAKAPRDTIVVRFNGGAQAGHTVTTPDGRRHVFGQVGSGTLAGAATFLSRFFVHNPLVADREYEHLDSLGARPMVYADPRGLVTTPYDMLINQAVERARGIDRHGSCGLGFGETLERAEQGYGLTIGDLDRTDRVVARLQAIRDRYVPARLARLGIADQLGDLAAFFQGDELIERFLATLDDYQGRLTIADSGLVDQYRHIVFEGAQGLLLDQDMGWFPYVTRSNTGLKNVVALAGEMGIDGLDVTYMTRAYLTRHGAGPLSGELPSPPYGDIVDATNIRNEWQGSLRFAWLDLDLLARTIARDLPQASGIDVSWRLGITCLDQISDKAGYLLNGQFCSGSPEGLVAEAVALTGSKGAVASWGPSRETVDRHMLADKFEQALATV